MSPHIAGWWAPEARQHIAQSKDYITPVFRHRECECEVNADEEDWGPDDLEDGDLESFAEGCLNGATRGVPNGLKCTSERWDESAFSRALGMVPKSMSTGCLAGFGVAEEENGDVAGGGEVRSRLQIATSGVPSTSGRKSKRTLKILSQQRFTSSIAIRWVGAAET